MKGFYAGPAFDVGYAVFVVNEDGDYYVGEVVRVTAGGVGRVVRGIYGDEYVPFASLRDYTWGGLK